MVGTAKNHLLQLKVGGVKNAFFKKNPLKQKKIRSSKQTLLSQPITKFQVQKHP